MTVALVDAQASHHRLSGATATASKLELRFVGRDGSEAELGGRLRRRQEGAPC